MFNNLYNIVHLFYFDQLVSECGYLLNAWSQRFLVIKNETFELPGVIINDSIWGWVWCKREGLTQTNHEHPTTTNSLIKKFLNEIFY